MTDFVQINPNSYKTPKKKLCSIVCTYVRTIDPIKYKNKNIISNGGCSILYVMYIHTRLYGLRGMFTRGRDIEFSIT